MENKMKEKKDFREKIREFRIGHPKLDVILDQIYGFFEKLYLGYWLLFIGIICLMGVILFWALPVSIREWASTIFTAVFSLIIAPLLLNIYNQDKQNKLKRFEKNYELYIELSKILVLLAIETKNVGIYTEKLEYVIQENFQYIYLNFSGSLFYDLMSLHISCENKNNANIKYYAEKCIRSIRRESDNSSEIRISYEIAKILENRKR